MNSTLKNSFSGRSVFVTGHTGFKGSWLCMWLKSLGAEVTGYALEPPTKPNNFTISRVENSLVKSHIADIRDESKMHRALAEAAPDIVFHLAAQSVVRESYRIPRETFEVNTIGVASLLDGVRKLDKPCSVVVVTSDKCYENVEQVWGYRESDPFGDHDPYGGSKGAAEILIRSYRHSFFPPEKLSEHGVKLASARAGNVIGGGDWTESALIVDVIQSLIEERPVELRNPGAFRPWQHVLQALSGYLTLAAKLAGSDDPEYCSGWNIGPLPGNELPVSEVVDLFLAEWGRGSWVNAGAEGEPREANILRLSIDKALWRLGWKPAWNIEDTLHHTAAWYKAYLNEPDAMHSFCLQQIAAYERDSNP
ncbi:MAG: CDP-glucose 4,6-dehydratase [Gammaproteobacteria bacterium]|nr:CDP-glucose 4,6-dehydratase [Gammaproteobacteria bacterium]NNL50020.1 CDP-glucose 4,6-dehydratase [Woeseiaceae bacterium]